MAAGLVPPPDYKALRRAAKEKRIEIMGRKVDGGGIAVVGLLLILWIHRRRRKSKSFLCSLLICSILLWELAACGGQPAESGVPPVQAGTSGGRAVSRELVYSHSMERQYAREFSVDYYEGGYALITLGGQECFLLVPPKAKIPGDLDSDIRILQQPLENLYVAASAVMDMFVALDALPQIRFSALKPEGWYIPQAREAMEKGEILYAGRYSAPDYERIVAEGCGLAVENTMIYHTPQVKEQLERFGVPVLVDYSSREQEPLGRTEWVRLYGLLMAREEQAEAAFAREKEAFESVEEENGLGKGVAFFYITSNGEVNIRKPSDYLPKMITFAGGCYLPSDLGEEENDSSTMTLQMEEFYGAAREADYLIYNSTVAGELISMEDLLAKNGLLKNFKAVREGRVFCTSQNLYQSTMSLGTIAHDIHEMLAGREGNLTYFYKLE